MTDFYNGVKSVFIPEEMPVDVWIFISFQEYQYAVWYEALPGAGYCEPATASSQQYEQEHKQLIMYLQDTV